MILYLNNLRIIKKEYIYDHYPTALFFSRSAYHLKNKAWKVALILYLMISLNCLQFLSMKDSWRLSALTTVVS